MIHSIEEFLHLRRPALVAEESRHTLTWEAIQREQRVGGGRLEEFFWTYHMQDGAIAHAFTEKRGTHLVLSSMDSAAASSLVEPVASIPPRLTGVEGPQSEALEFAGAWNRYTGGTHRVEMEQGLWEVKQVHLPDTHGGKLVQATAEHRNILIPFAAGFSAECFPSRTLNESQLAVRMDRYIASGKAFLWQNEAGESVAMACIVRDSPTTSSISWVYTPPKKRGLGYGACVVAFLSQEQLDGGKKACNLHTDLENPTSNALYRRLGYQPVERQVCLQFLPAH